MERYSAVISLEAECVMTLLRGEQVQTLIGDLADDVTLIHARAYRGLCGVDNGKKWIRLSLLRVSKAELITTLCHELAHHKVGLSVHHGFEWRREFERQVRKAGDLGLLQGEDLKQALRLARDGVLREGLGDVEKLEGVKHYWKEQGLQVGSHIIARCIGRGDEKYVVVRMNKRTLTCWELPLEMRREGEGVIEYLGRRAILGERGRWRIPYSDVKEIVRSQGGGVQW